MGAAKFTRRLHARMKRWWQGEFEKFDPRHPNIMPSLQWHWTARAVRAIVDFYLRHWKFLWTIAVAIAAVIVAAR